LTARWRAPGRVNLIGEHTDYNDGFALPFALELGCTATVTPRSDELVVARSAQRDGEVRVNLSALLPGGGEWAAYAIGAVWAFRERGADIRGLTIDIDSDVPIGSGLSSSAAVVCSVVTAVDDALGLGFDEDALLDVSRSVENDFVGAPTGGLDQLVALRAEPGAALLCDMRTLHTEPVPLPLADAGLSIVVIDTRAEHRHSDGEYRQRRAGCERAAAELGVRALREIRPDDLDAALRRLNDDELRRYVRHVVTENERVLRVVELLRGDRLSDIGPLLTESHESMRDDYRITVDEVDLAVETLLRTAALGARMTGGGFGGCVIGLVVQSDVQVAMAAVREAYAHAGLHEPRAFVVEHAARSAHRM
jgi:galactokinase